MGWIKSLLSHGSQAASFMLGGLVLATALATPFLSGDVSTLTGWALDVMGSGFLTLLGGLVFVTVLSLVRMLDTAEAGPERDFWLGVGVQAANGVTTLALTFTLLGISLGIGGLATQELTPQTVQLVIANLTGNFSLAFMTTVIGLPLSAALRALMLIVHGRLQLEANNLLNERTQP